METAVEYVAPVSAQNRAVPDRGHLRVVDGTATYSALPHAVLFTGLTDGAIRLYAVLQSHWWGESGECTASHATLAAETGKKPRTIRALLTELVSAGFVAERRIGRGQAKAYSASEPDPSGRNLPVESGDIRPVAYPKRQKSASQAAKNGQFKRQISAAPIEEDSGKKTLEEDTPLRGVVAADAAPAPPPPAEKPKKQVRSKRPSPEETTAPETIELTAVSYASALKMGFDREAVDFELERFLSKARSKGWTYVDWKAGFKTWLLNAVEYARRDGRPVGSTPGSRQNGATKPRDDDHLQSSAHRVEYETIYVGDPHGQ